jgi:hypothetical protein
VQIAFVVDGLDRTNSIGSVRRIQASLISSGFSSRSVVPL